VVEPAAPAATEATPEPDVLVMADAAQVTTAPATEEAVSVEPATVEPAPETVSAVEVLPTEELVAVVEDDVPASRDDGSDSSAVAEISNDRATEIRRLNAEGKSVRSIARTLHVKEREVRQCIEPNLFAG
jgi:hypothetical protein